MEIFFPKKFSFIRFAKKKIQQRQQFVCSQPQGLFFFTFLASFFFSSKEKIMKKNKYYHVQHTHTHHACINLISVTKVTHHHHRIFFLSIGESGNNGKFLGNFFFLCISISVEKKMVGYNVFLLFFIEILEIFLSSEDIKQTKKSKESV